MNAASLINDKKFVKDQLRNVRKSTRSILSKDEIQSDLHMAIVNCAERFDPKKGDIFTYVRYSFFNMMRRSVADRLFLNSVEAPLEAAFDRTYEDNDPEDYSLRAYISTMPQELVEGLTDLVLGKKTKDDLLSKPSFQKINIDRILEKLDGII